MWIENTDAETYPTRALRHELTDGELVEFSENWKANVPQEIGERLVNEFDHLEPATDSSSSAPSSDTNPDTE